ncbi:hypothetical protein GA0115240_137825 [Streptomyces sp. DvalAA-14]|nr:hypothetical protein GA0115240_137825 [Streptomyces sp. DvalAA-14]
MPSLTRRSVPGVRVTAPFVPSVARGVGSRPTVVRKSAPPCPCGPAPLVSEVRGVGSNGKDDESPSLVGSADIRRAYKTPLRIEPDAGKVPQDLIKSNPKVVRDVLKYRELGS